MITNNLRGKVACVGLATAGTGEATGRNAMDISMCVLLCGHGECS